MNFKFLLLVVAFFPLMDAKRGGGGRGGGKSAGKGGGKSARKSARKSYPKTVGFGNNNFLLYYLLFHEQHRVVNAAVDSSPVRPLELIRRNSEEIHKQMSDLVDYNFVCKTSEEKGVSACWWQPIDQPITTEYLKDHTNTLFANDDVRNTTRGVDEMMKYNFVCKTSKEKGVSACHWQKKDEKIKLEYLSGANKATTNCFLLLLLLSSIMLL